MIDSIFAKFLLLIASLLSITVGGINYVQVGQENLAFDFKTRDSYPIYYYLQTQNIGSQKMRFDISSDVSWIYVFREGQPGVTSLELPEQAAINFILEIHPENLNNGQNQAKITVNAVGLFDYSLVDSKEVNVTLNKNVVATPTQIPTPTISPSESPEAMLSATPEPEISASPTPTPSPVSSTETELNSILNQLKTILDSLRLLLMNFFGA